MADKIVQLKDRDGNNIFPVTSTGESFVHYEDAGKDSSPAIGTDNLQDNSVTKEKIGEDFALYGDTVSEPSSVEFVGTDNIRDEAVTADKINWNGIHDVLYYNASPVGSTSLISLTHSASDYESIDVYFTDDQNFSNIQSVYIGKRTGSIPFCLQLSKASGIADTIYVSSRRCTVNGTTLQVDLERNTNITNGVYPTVQTSTNLKIYKVVGNKI